MVKMSRRMPPTPVAAPWWGSMAEGWLWLSMRMATAMPSPASITPAFSPGPTRTPGSLGRQPAEVHARRLVRAVLAPHDRVQGELEPVGRPAEHPGDLGELVVGQAERAVEGLVVALRAGHGPTLPVGGSTAVRARRPLRVPAAAPRRPGFRRIPDGGSRSGDRSVGILSAPVGLNSG